MLLESLFIETPLELFLTGSIWSCSSIVLFVFAFSNRIEHKYNFVYNWIRKWRTAPLSLFYFVHQASSTNQFLMVNYSKWINEQSNLTSWPTVWFVLLMPRFVLISLNQQQPHWQHYRSPLSSYLFIPPKKPNKLIICGPKFTFKLRKINFPSTVNVFQIYVLYGWYTFHWKVLLFVQMVFLTFRIHCSQTCNKLAAAKFFIPYM